jgi:hypothetical protein
MSQIKEQYRSSMTEEELIDTATVSVLAGQPVKLGEYVVSAGEMIMLGYETKSGLDDAVGRIFANIKDNSASPGVELKGKLRLSAYTPQGRPMRILAEFDTDIVNDNETDRTKQTPFPANGIFLSEDKKLVLEFISKTTATVGKTNSRILFDVTQAVV